jgi:hypothetical protein
MGSGYKVVIVVTSVFQCHFHVLHVWVSSQWAHLVLTEPSFLPSSRVLKNGKSLLKYVGRKVRFQFRRSPLSRSNKNAGRSSWTWICFLVPLLKKPPHGVPMWMSLQDPGKPSEISWKEISLAICYLQVLLPQEGASHIYVLITYHSPTQPIGNPYPPSKNLVL